jgi:hypothetical protein
MNEGIAWKIGVDVDNDQYWLTVDGLKKGDKVKPLTWWELTEVLDIVTRWRQGDLVELGTVQLWMVRKEFADLLVASWKCEHFMKE